MLFKQKVEAVSCGLLGEAGEEVRVQGHQLLGNFVQGRVPTLEDPNTLRPRLAQEKKVSLQVEAQLLSFSRHVTEQKLKGNKNEPSKSCRADAVNPPLYHAVTFPEMIDGISLRFRFDRPFQRLFRNQFLELAPRPQHSVQKIPSNGMQNLPNKCFAFIVCTDVLFLKICFEMR